MSLTNDERTWLDEKFVNLHKRIDEIGQEVKLQRRMEQDINDLRVDVGKRPTLVQLLSATAAAFGLGLTFAGILVNII